MKHDPFTLSIQTDGTPEGTYVIDNETGRRLSGVQTIEVRGEFRERPMSVFVRIGAVLHDQNGSIGQTDDRQIRIIDLMTDETFVHGEEPTTRKGSSVGNLTVGLSIDQEELETFIARMRQFKGAMRQEMREVFEGAIEEFTRNLKHRLMMELKSENK